MVLQIELPIDFESLVLGSLLSGMGLNVQRESSHWLDTNKGPQSSTLSIFC